MPVRALAGMSLSIHHAPRRQRRDRLARFGNKTLGRLMSGIAGLHPLQTLHTWRRRSHKDRAKSLCRACLAIAKTTLSGRRWIRCAELRSANDVI